MERIFNLAAKRWLRDKLEYFSRKNPGPLEGVSGHGLGATQVYPCGDNIQSMLKLSLEKEFKDLTIDTSAVTTFHNTIIIYRIFKINVD